MKDEFGHITDQIKNAVMIIVLDSLFGSKGSDFAKQQARASSGIQRLSGIFSGLIGPGVAGGYKKGIIETVRSLRSQGIAAHPRADMKAVEVLAKDSIRDFEVATAGGQTELQNFFYYTKQGILTESEISGIIGRGIAENADSESAVRELAQNLRKRLKSSTIASIPQSQEDDLVKLYLQKLRRRGVPSQFMDRFERLIREDKFLRIINKNGDPMQFRVSNYAELVTRYRVAEAQTIGTMNQAQFFGVTEFRISSHGTDCHICGPHEGKTYTTDHSTPYFEYFSPENRPPYHGHCKHRANAITRARAISEVHPDMEAA